MGRRLVSVLGLVAVLLGVQLLLLSSNALGSAGQSVYVMFGPTDFYFTDTDTIVNEPLSYQQKWHLDVNNGGEGVVTHPRFEFLSTLPFVSFGSDGPEIFTPEPELGRYVWDWGPLEIAPQYGVAVDAQLDEIVKRPRIAVRRTVEPRILTQPSTLQTITVDFELMEPLPADCNSIFVSIGSPAHADAHNLVDGEFVWQSDVEGWTSRPGPTSAFWAIDPGQLQVGVPYTFQAVLQAVRSDELLGSPLYIPGVSVDYWYTQQLDTQTGTSVTVTHPEGSSAIFSLDQEVDWYVGLQNWRSIQWLNPRVFMVTEPPYHVLIPASVRIEPETINRKSNGVVTAFVTLPEEYDAASLGGVVWMGSAGAPASSVVVNARTIIAKFRTSQMQLVAGDSVELWVVGELGDGTMFVGTDTVRVIH